MKRAQTLTHTETHSDATPTEAVHRKGRKIEQVLDGARRVFMADGFEGASVDDIARAAGVSKATLYSYFPDKRVLFTEVARIACARMAEETVESIDDSKPVREVLTFVARQLATFLTSPFAVRIFRVCASESDRFPDLGRAFYENGPELGRCRLREYFAEAVACGQLVIDDLDMAAEQFSELCKARIWVRVVFGVQADVTAEEIDHVAEEAVETFLARYGA
ncbi:MAG: TetR/AcrR family transcriptional regulator [Marinibacterium sp.]